MFFMGGGVSRGTFVKVLRSVKVFKVSKVLRPFENDGGFVCSWWILNLVFLRGVGLGVEGWILEIFGIGFWGYAELDFGDFWN